MRVALILPGNIWFSPYLKIYTKILDVRKVPYDIISWNRDGTDEKMGYQYSSNIKTHGRLSKIIPYLCYSRFVKRIIIANKYDRLIVFGPQVAIFLAGLLSKKYKKRFIFDYRDLSIEQYKFLRLFFKKVLKNSYANVISSPGFKQCLPSGYNYLISHNFDIDNVIDALSLNRDKQINSTSLINVLTIGGIRDYSSNAELLKSLANIDDIEVNFVGKGPSAPLLKDYCIRNCINNVYFEGYYPKEKEKDYIQQSTYLNIYYPKIISHSTALSNRFYNSLIYRKPMIVTSNSIQGYYVEKYSLGLSINDCKDLDIKLRAYLKSEEYKRFNENCRTLLGEFVKDYQIFEGVLMSFIN